MMKDWRERRDIEHSLRQGETLLSHADYDGSLKQYQNVLSLAPERPPSDLAWLNIGVIYSHPLNPQRDPEKAFNSFSHVITDFPNSPWVQQARAWVGVLEEENKARQEIDRAKQMLEQANEALNKSKQELDSAKQELEKSRQLFERTKAELEKSRAEIDRTKQVIEKSRQVDIEIEQKKRARGR